MKKTVISILCLFGIAGLLAPSAYAGDPVSFRGGTVRSVDFLPEPPRKNSAGFARDVEIYRESRAEKGGKRWQQAAFDADIHLDKNAGRWFEHSLGMKIDKKETPALYRLMLVFYRAQHEAARSAKKHYRRERPYVYYQTAGETCAPWDEQSHQHNGSYPSGHSAMGWGMALILTEIAPARQAALLSRGYEIGQSRVICGYHWQSDVEAGRMVGAAVVAQLHSDPAFIRLLEKARAEAEARQVR